MRKIVMLWIAALMTALAVTGAFAHGTGMHKNQDGMEMNHNMVLHHIVLGGGYEIGLLFRNPGSGRDVIGIFYFYAQDGAALNVTWNDAMQTSIPFAVPQSGTFALKLGNPEDPQ